MLHPLGLCLRILSPQIATQTTYSLVLLGSLQCTYMMKFFLSIFYIVFLCMLGLHVCLNSLCFGFFLGSLSVLRSAIGLCGILPSSYGPSYLLLSPQTVSVLLCLRILYSYPHQFRIHFLIVSEYRIGILVVLSQGILQLIILF